MVDPSRPTIFALSSGRPPVAIAVIRISGPRAAAALEALGIKIPAPRKAGLARIRDPRSGEIIDEALVLWFPGPHSETGEDVAELQAHGGRAVIAAILDALGSIDGLRMAEPGEFTRRGFENGKLDLTAVEGLADLVAAETEGQRRQAFRQMRGLLGGRAETWRQRLIKALALIEARIDFSDEADVPEDLIGPALAIVQELRDEIATALADGGRGERLREGLVVAIAGPPNAGKSSLLNRIARREAAIVSPYAGTTRDVIEVHLDLGGLPVTLLDTAGIRDTDDPVELEGVQRARARAAGADLVLWVVDASEVAGGRPLADRLGRSSALLREGEVSSSATGSLPTKGGQGGDPSDVSGPGGAWSSAELSNPPTSGAGAVWSVLNKIDLLDQTLARSEQKDHFLGRNEAEADVNKPLKVMLNSRLTHKSELGFRTKPLLPYPGASYRNELLLQKFTLSASTGLGFERLLEALKQFAEEHMSGGEQVLVTRARHRQLLEKVREALSGALAAGGQEELLAEQLRTAGAALGRLTGRVDVEDVLDVIFGDFCIGK